MKISCVGLELEGAVLDFLEHRICCLGLPDSSPVRLLLFPWFGKRFRAAVSVRFGRKRIRAYAEGPNISMAASDALGKISVRMAKEKEKWIRRKLSMRNGALVDIEGAETAEKMTVNEAIKKLSDDGSEYLVFRDSERKGSPVTVAYLREGDGCGILES